MFVDDLLLDFCAYGFRSQRNWLTTRVQLRSGRTRRNAERTRPRFRFVAPYDRINEAHQSRLASAYDVCLGPVHSFRFRSKTLSERFLDNAIIGTAVGGADETMQLIHPSDSFGGLVFSRIITKPADASKYTVANGYEADAVPLALTEDTGGGASPLAFTVDYLTGIVTFTSSAGATIRATCEYHWPVHFDDDTLDIDLTTFKAHSADVTLVEDFGA